ncbi:MULTISPECIES: TetR/AcrR family transcriptional regulator [unclassified Mycobacteroides]|uniref:TetR/AcrR family transcriptional regulator n=1 Tax=unclassified Mycobacteroides TaxID=2618759 RepID=UPI00132A8A4F|nr:MULTISPECIES: TetR/AcrR family transcriptional regulator [unclassified Mycobacteroides]MUM19281.1 TetR family transcriptional regulator [Mycobacteroides sp. CBMA 326]
MRSKSGIKRTFTEVARREQIVACAMEVIAEVGYPQTTIRKIADRAGIAMSVVLYHFGSKDGLVEAVIASMYQTALAEVPPAVRRERTPTAQLAAYIRASVGYFDTHRMHLAALSQLGTSYKPSDGRRLGDLELTPELTDQLAELDPSAILRAGQKSGEFASFPVDSTAIAVRGAVNAVVEKVLQNADFDAHGYAEDLVKLFTRAVRRV